MFKVIRRLREMREQHYVLLRGFFHGATDAGDHLAEADQPRLLAVTLGEGAHAIGKHLAELHLDACGAAVSTVRRKGAARKSGGLEDVLADGDVVVLLGTPQSPAAGETKLLRGKFGNRDEEKLAA